MSHWDHRSVLQRMPGPEGDLLDMFLMGSWSTWRKHTQARGKRAKSTQKYPKSKLEIKPTNCLLWGVGSRDGISGSLKGSDLKEPFVHRAVQKSRLILNELRQQVEKYIITPSYVMTSFRYVGGPICFVKRNSPFPVNICSALPVFMKSKAGVI